MYGPLDCLRCPSAFEATSPLSWRSLVGNVLRKPHHPSTNSGPFSLSDRLQRTLFEKSKEQEEYCAHLQRVLRVGSRMVHVPRSTAVVDGVPGIVLIASTKPFATTFIQAVAH